MARAVSGSLEDPHEAAVGHETLEIEFVAAIQHLPPRPRAALILRDVAGFSARETAKLLGTSVTAVNSDRDVTLLCMSHAPLEKLVAEKRRHGWTMPYVSAHGSDFLFDYGYAFRREGMSGTVREEFDMGQLLREAPQWLRDYREDVGAPDLESAVSVSAGWNVFAMRDGTVYNTYRVYPHSRLITPLFSGLFELLPNKE